MRARTFPSFKCSRMTTCVAAAQTATKHLNQSLLSDATVNIADQQETDADGNSTWTNPMRSASQSDRSKTISVPLFLFTRSKWKQRVEHVFDHVFALTIAPPHRNSGDGGSSAATDVGEADAEKEELTGIAGAVHACTVQIPLQKRAGHRRISNATSAHRRDPVVCGAEVFLSGCGCRLRGGAADISALQTGNVRRPVILFT